MSHITLPQGLPITASCLFIPACSLVVGLRFYARRVQKTPFGVDDWLMLPALALVLGMQITMLVEYSDRLIDYPDPNFKPGFPDARSNLPFFPIEVMEIPALGLVKLSLLFLFRRIFNTGLFRWFDYFSGGMIGITITWILGFFFTWIFICGTHPSHYWKSAKVEKTTCVNTPMLHNAFSISDVILDIIVLTMTLPMFAVTGIFSFGLITVAASVTRMAIFLQSTAARYDPDIDFESLVTDGIYWSMLEVGLGMLAANLVVVYGLFVGRGLGSVFHGARRVLSLPSTLNSLRWLHGRSNSDSKSDEENKPAWDTIDLVQNRSHIESSVGHVTHEDQDDGIKDVADSGHIYTSSTVVQLEERL